MKELESGNPIPKPTPVEFMKPVQGGFVTMLMMDMNAYAAKAGESSVKKSLSIPRWLNSFAESQQIDYSELLRSILTLMYEERYSPETALPGRPLPLISQRR